jgi:hypothetical protein
MATEQKLVKSVKYTVGQKDTIRMKMDIVGQQLELHQRWYELVVGYSSGFPPPPSDVKVHRKDYTDMSSESISVCAGAMYEMSITDDDLCRETVYYAAGPITNDSCVILTRVSSLIFEENGYPNTAWSVRDSNGNVTIVVHVKSRVADKSTTVVAAPTTKTSV